MSNGYVKKTADTPAAAPATNLSECLMYDVDGMYAPKYYLISLGWINLTKINKFKFTLL